MSRAGVPLSVLWVLFTCVSVASQSSDVSLLVLVFVVGFFLLVLLFAILVVLLVLDVVGVVVQLLVCVCGVVLWWLAYLFEVAYCCF